MPDLDKLIKLADLFGVSMDELVREEERPQPPKPEPQVIYVKEKRSLTKPQTTGVCVEAAGLALALLGLIGEGDLLLLISAALVILGLPLLLAKKHPWIIFGWLLVGLSLVVLNPNYSLAPWGLWGGIQRIKIYILSGGERYIAYLIAGVIGVVRGLLTLVLIVLTWRAWKNRSSKKGQR